MKKQEFRQLIREHIRKIVKEEIDNKQWMDITAALIKSKMFLNKATFRFVNTDTMSKDLTRKSLEDFLMNGAKEGLWDEKVAQEYMMAIEGTAKKQLKETYYNPEWKYTSVHSWLEKYAAKNKLPFKLIHKTNKNSTIGKHAKTNTYYVYDIGDKYGIVVRNEKVPGAPRLDQLYVIAGPKGSTLGSLVGASTLTDGSEQELAKFLDKVLGTIKEGLDSKPIKSFKVTDLAKIFTKIGFPTTKVEVFDNVSAGPTLSIEFKNTLADENEFIDAYTDFQFDNGALGSWLPDIESAYHKGGNKWEFQMQK